METRCMIRIAVLPSVRFRTVDFRELLSMLARHTRIDHPQSVPSTRSNRRALCSPAMGERWSPLQVYGGRGPPALGGHQAHQVHERNGALRGSMVKNKRPKMHGLDQEEDLFSLSKLTTLLVMAHPSIVLDLQYLSNQVTMASQDGDELQRY
ncbi:hypothetical protein HPP92_029058 [Vanilla planifolia]|uniref:Uncharacterized protein n=1 Tax=Vanilla planifolia TaxID=51239 RepID=A0A835P3P3_VANPL|nr:hypothetical protein HPP92_029058 [Vanilla planifolia]KAG0446001.1 hypothetical protein HPP92_029047 [Vanilla planifolia]